MGQHERDKRCSQHNSAPLLTSLSFNTNHSMTFYRYTTTLLLWSDDYVVGTNKYTKILTQGKKGRKQGSTREFAGTSYLGATLTTSTIS